MVWNFRCPSPREFVSARRSYSSRCGFWYSKPTIHREDCAGTSEIASQVYHMYKTFKQDNTWFHCSFLVSMAPSVSTSIYKPCQFDFQSYPKDSQGMSNIITIFFQHASNIGPVKIHHAGTTFYNMIMPKITTTTPPKWKKLCTKKKKRNKQQMRQMNIFPSVLHPHNPWYLVHDQRRLALAGPSGWQTKWRRCLWEKKEREREEKEKRKRREREERQRKTISRKRIQKDRRWQRRESVSCRCVVVKCVDRRCADVR